MAKIVDALKVISTSSNVQDVLKILGLTSRTFEVLVAEINAIEDGLVTIRGDEIHLTRSLSWILHDEVLAKLSAFNLKDYSLEILAEVDSTNTYLLENVAAYREKSIVVAEYQKMGRGRPVRGSAKSWRSKIGLDLAVSVSYSVAINFPHSLLPLVTAVAVNRMWRGFDIESTIKWPNDIMLTTLDKITGILVEARISKNSKYVVIGVGINNIRNFSRSALLASLIMNLDHLLQEYHTFGFDLLQEEWKTNCIHLGREVAVYSDVGQLIASGINCGIGCDGALLLKTQSGIESFSSSAISIRFAV